MKNLQGKTILELASQAGKLTQDQQAAFNAKKLRATSVAYIHRAVIGNTGTANGIPLYNETAIRSIGLTTLDQGCKVPENCVITGLRANVAKLTNSANLAAAEAAIKAAEYNNLVLNLGLTTNRIPALLVSSHFEFKAKGDRVSIIPVKDFLVLGNQKNYAEASDEDVVMLPDGLQMMQQGETLLPLLHMPEGSSLSANAFGDPSNQYVWETIYLGFKITIAN